ncbi:hypothetical protein SAMN05421734_101328 [Pelagirhabdus alkalitolerans]|uniref:Serine aminopeptidase S33 domain-containing protein n=1 Tax=Pelagirhabdus alkalitolerans TaxID=1612202 RepID=A0A1G6GNU3_9BACI|nr:alpha/beta hydrolase [Pelagirhabdus alkalitolerans]SDB83618.1 hypothetical protein SAMN05421734_101328 [Pelagirhabdus alkalitolerans]
MMKFEMIEHNHKQLTGTVHIPDNERDQHPTVIMFHGFGGSRLESKGLFVRMSRYFEERGIASVRFDFSGHGESEGDFYDVTLSNEVDEAKAIVDYVKGLDFVDPDRIDLLGLSLGGVVASIVAGEMKESIHALCMWAPAAVVLDDVNKQKQIQGRDIEEEMSHQGYFDFYSLRVGPSFVDDLKTFELFERAKQYEKRVKIIHGSDDQVVPLSYSHQYMTYYGAQGELSVLEGADHAFGTYPDRMKLYEETYEFFKQKH